MGKFNSASVALTVITLFGFVPQSALSSQDPRSFPLTKTEPDRGPKLPFSAAQPFHLELGRGSGRHGLDTIAVDQTGDTVLFRRRLDAAYGVVWETAKLNLSQAAIHRILSGMLQLGLLEMARAYHADVWDGEQWIFWVKQGGKQKSIYFNNHFPNAIQSFAGLLDSELQKADIKNAKWLKVPRKEDRRHEKEIWQSIHDKSAPAESSSP
jgi:hypothetical protein